MFESRVTATEFMDRPDCDPALAAASYRFMGMVNCRFGGIRIVRLFLAAETAGHHAGAPLRILEIGSGCCDIPLAVSQWARAYGIALHFTCLEMAGHAVDIARVQFARAVDTAVHLLQKDALTHQQAEPYDCAVASMCFHHFSNAQILTLLQGLRGFVIHGLLINDLRRSRLASLVARLLLAGTGAPTGVWHDALLSIRRGFKASEVSNLLRQLDSIAVSV